MICPECQAVNPDTQQFCGECGTRLTSSSEIPASVTKTLGTPIHGLVKESMFAGRYRIIEELGRGGMGVVYKAEDTKLKRTVALKFLPTELTHVSEIKERFMREAQAAAALDHPNICTVHEFDEAEEKTFISMAFVKGQSLKKKIESEPLEIEETIRITIQAAEGLQEAHRQGIIHRDIKSANIMVDERDQVKIMDFGLARMTGGTMVTREGATMGTIAYMSPEQARGEEVDFRTDIWSLGVVLYEILSGQLPFKGEHEQAVMYSIFKEKPKPITDVKPEIPMAIELVVSKALEKNPDERYQQVEELIDDLKSISAGIVPEGIRTRLRKMKIKQRKKAILYGGTAGFLIIVTVVAISLFTGRTKAIDSIAVLPLENLSGDPEKEYFSDGITDALINELAKVSSLRVISRQSMMQYKGSKKSLAEIARELNVDAVVEASVLTVEDRIQIRAKLILAPNEQNLWAQEFERDLSNALILQSEMARTIASEIRVKLTPQEEKLLTSARQIDPETLEAYLRGRSLLYQQTPQKIKRAVEYLEKAVAEDPDYALAYATLSQAYNYLRNATPADQIQERQKLLDRFRIAVEKALELDDSLSEAHRMASLAHAFDWDWAGEEHHMYRALELGPNNLWAHIIYSKFLSRNGRHEEAIREAKLAVELDPLIPSAHLYVAVALSQARRHDEAIEKLQEILKIWPNNGNAWSELAYNHVAQGQKEEAVESWQKQHEIQGNKKMAEAYKTLGFESAMRIWLAQATGPSPQLGATSYTIAHVNAMLGEKEQALAWLERAYRERDLNLRDLTTAFYWDLLRGDPRFQDLLDRIGMWKKLNSEH